MDRTGSELFAGPRLPGDQDRGVRSCHHVDLLEHLEERRTLPNDFPERQSFLHLLVEVRVLQLKLPPESGHFLFRALSLRDVPDEPGEDWRSGERNAAN